MYVCKLWKLLLGSHSRDYWSNNLLGKAVLIEANMVWPERWWALITKLCQKIVVCELKLLSSGVFKGFGRFYRHGNNTTVRFSTNNFIIRPKTRNIRVLTSFCKLLVNTRPSSRRKNLLYCCGGLVLKKRSSLYWGVFARRRRPNDSDGRIRTIAR